MNFDNVNDIKKDKLTTSKAEKHQPWLRKLPMNTDNYFKFEHSKKSLNNYIRESVLRYMIMKGNIISSSHIYFYDDTSRLALCKLFELLSADSKIVEYFEKTNIDKNKVVKLLDNKDLRKTIYTKVHFEEPFEEALENKTPKV